MRSGRPVFVFFMCLYALSLGRGFYSSDGEVMFKTTAALVTDHTFALDPDPGLPQIIPGQGDNFYSKYDPGLPLLAIPLYVTGDWVAEINAAHRYRVAAIFVLLLPVIAAALALVGLARLVDALMGVYSRNPSFPAQFAIQGQIGARNTDRTLDLRRGNPWVARFWGRASPAPTDSDAIESSEQSRPSIPSPFTGRGLGGGAYVILAAGLATPLWVYARTLFAETMLAAALTWAVVIIHHRGTDGTEKHKRTVDDRSDSHLDSPSPYVERGLGGEVLAGIIVGIGILTRAAFVIYLPALIWLMLRTDPAPDRRWNGRDQAIRLIAFGAGIAPFMGILLWHNAHRFGDALQFGYADEGFTTPVWEGVIGLLFSADKSVFLYAPPLMLSLILWPRFRRVFPALGEFLVVAWGGALLFYGAWWAWHGGWCWGPRFLVPLMPLSCLPLMNLTPRPPLRTRRGGDRRLFVDRFPPLHRVIERQRDNPSPMEREERPFGAGGLFWILLALGIAIQLLGLLVDITPHYAALTTPDGVTDYATLNTDPREAALVHAAEQVIAGKTESLTLLHLNETGLPPTWTIGVPIICIMGLLWGGRRLYTTRR